MSYENTKCPCGGKKEMETMLCAECVAHIETIPEAIHDLRHYMDEDCDLSTRRTMAIRLLTIAHRRKSKRELPLSYRA